HQNYQGDGVRPRRSLYREYFEMPAGHAGQRLWQSAADAARDANLPAIFDGTDRHHPTESDRGARRGGGGRTSWDALADARTARTLEFVQWHAANGHLSSGVSAAKSVAVGETQGVGRHDASLGATRETDQREAAQLFSVNLAINGKARDIR